MTETTDEFLQHYGVPGMKWGQRKGGSSVTKSAPRESRDFREAQKIKQKKPSEMTNKELTKLNTRGNLEQQYSKMNPTTIKKGQLIVKSVIGTAGAGLALYNMVNSQGGKAAIRVGKNMIYKAKFMTGITKAITVG